MNINLELKMFQYLRRQNVSRPPYGILPIHTFVKIRSNSFFSSSDMQNSTIFEDATLLVLILYLFFQVL